MSKQGDGEMESKPKHPPSPCNGGNGVKPRASGGSSGLWRLMSDSTSSLTPRLRLLLQVRSLQILRVFNDIETVYRFNDVLIFTMGRIKPEAAVVGRMSRSQGGAEQEAQRALELAEGYLESAENVLWRSTVEIDSHEVSNSLEELTEELWGVQQQLYDLKEQIDDQQE